MSGERRSSTLATKLGELVADSSRANGKRAQTMRMINAAAAPFSRNESGWAGRTSYLRKAGAVKQVNERYIYLLQQTKRW